MYSKFLPLKIKSQASLPQEDPDFGQRMGFFELLEAVTAAEKELEGFSSVTSLCLSYLLSLGTLELTFAVAFLMPLKISLLGRV